MKIIPLELLTLEGNGHHLIVEIEILEKTFKMVLDTGASKTVLDYNTLLNAGITEDQFIVTNIMSSGLGTNEMKSHMFDLPQLKIGDWTSNKMKVAVLDLSTINYAYEQMNFPAVVGVLGGDILYYYNAIIDYNKKTLRLNDRKKNRAK